jgi:uncharacterized protein (DUF58 family)
MPNAAPFGTLEGVRPSVAELVALRRPAQGLATSLRRSADRLLGQQESPFRGRGMEYAESRPYSAGDEVRHIDWRVTARTGRPYTKLFQAERERTTLLVLESSAAMRFGTRVCFKSVQAARLGALLAWAAQGEGDRIAACCFGDRRAQLPPRGSRGGVMRTLAALVQWSAGEPESPQPHALSHALEKISPLLRPGSRILLLIDPASLDERALQVLNRVRAHHDIAACLLADALELVPPPPGRYLASLAGQRRWLLRKSADDPTDWLSPVQACREEARLLLRRKGVRARVVAAQDDPVRALRALLQGGPDQSAGAA